MTWTNGLTEAIERLRFLATPQPCGRPTVDARDRMAIAFVLDALALAAGEKEAVRLAAQKAFFDMGEDGQRMEWLAAALGCSLPEAVAFVKDQEMERLEKRARAWKRAARHMRRLWRYEQRWSARQAEALLQRDYPRTKVAIP